MAGSLVKISEETVTSAVASVTLTGIDSTYDVYKVVYSNLVSATDASIGSNFFQARFTESGTPNSTANYDRASKTLNSDTTFANNAATNETQFYPSNQGVGTGTGEATNGILYIFNANNSSEYTFYTMEQASFTYLEHLRGQQGGGVFTVTSAVNGIQFFNGTVGASTENFAGGIFTLYGLKS
jgi:hypothetical protein